MAKNKQSIEEKQITGFALITGASKGIGRALAIECAKKEIDLALVDLPNSGLQNIITYLNKHYRITVKSFETDLTVTQAPKKIHQWTKKEEIPVQLLINNAGLGHLGPFSEYSYAFYENIIRLNIESVVLLTHLFLPEIKQQKAGYILNLGSLASFYPIPYKTVYSSSKAFILSFSQALNCEMKKCNVKVSVLCPGPIITSPEVIQRIKQGGFWAKITSMRSKKMANIAMKALFKGKPIIVPGAINRFFLLVDKIIPDKIKLRILTKKFNVKEKVTIYSSEKPPNYINGKNTSKAEKIEDNKIKI